jgi:hypothetical protein
MGGATTPVPHTPLWLRTGTLYSVQIFCLVLKVKNFGRVYRAKGLQFYYKAAYNNKIQLWGT